MIDLDTEAFAAASNVRAVHIDRMVALGVPLKSLATIGAHWPSFGVQRVRWVQGGTYEPDPDGEPAAIVPVPAAERGLGELGLVDLLAFSSADPRKWSWRTGDGWLLGEWLLGEYHAEPVVVAETPLHWLATAGDALCVLNWGAPASCWSKLRAMPALTFTSETLRARVERAMRQSLSLPNMGIQNVAA